MHLLLPLLSLLALIPRCVAEISEVDASLMLWYYTSYDLDFEVQGRNRTIARGCKGSGTDNKCDFNEFLNYIQTGEATTEPKYYEVTSDFSFYVGDVAAIITALRMIAKGDAVQFELIMKGVKTAVGLSRNLAKIADKSYKAAQEKKKDISRAKNNMKVALSAVAHHAQVQGETAMILGLKGVKDLTVKTKKRTSQMVEKASDRIDWRATVEAHKDLAKRGTQLFKDTASAIRNVHKTDTFMRVRVFTLTATSLAQGCFT
ncbi:hypothetical protein LIA77_00040 [Sarocladium implicatum]|nr:hypothetical protein LIA77_00040 [Sarocladium implicatum]